jgi:hypothetical protein
VPVFRVVTPSGLVGRDKGFEGTYYIHLQGWTQRLQNFSNAAHRALQPRRPSRTKKTFEKIHSCILMMILQMSKWKLCKMDFN